MKIPRFAVCDFNKNGNLGWGDNDGGVFAICFTGKMITLEPGCSFISLFTGLALLTGLA